MKGFFSVAKMFSLFPLAKICYKMQHTAAYNKTITKVCLRIDSKPEAVGAQPY